MEKPPAKKGQIRYRKLGLKTRFLKIPTAKPGCKAGCKICPSALRNGRENPLCRTPNYNSCLLCLTVTSPIPTIAIKICLLL